MRINKQFGITIIFIMFISGYEFLNAQLMHPSNLDFELGVPGKMPRGWVLPAYAASRHYNASMTDYKSKSGKYCLELNRFAPYKDSLYGSVMQSVDAKPYRGKTVRFGAWVRAEISGPRGSAHLWLIEYNKQNNISYYDLMEDRPIVSNEWDFYEIFAEIPDDADYINFGLMLKGNGKAWIDGAKFEIADTSLYKFSPPKKLSKREVHNLFVFAKLFGFAQFYNPSSEALNLDFDKFLLSSIRKVENVKNDTELIDSLNSIFHPIFPALKIYNKSLPPEEYYYTSQPDKARQEAALAELHVGAPTMPQNQLTFSRVVNVFNSLRQSEGAVVQLLNAESFRGKEITFSVYAKAETIEPNGRAEIRIGAEDKNETKSYILNNLKFVRIKGNNWKLYKINLKVPNDASALRIGLVLIGDGYVRFDNAALTLRNDSNNIDDFRNGDFEIDRISKISHGWRLIKSALKAGYSARIIRNDIKHGKQALEIVSSQENRIPLPHPGDLLLGDLDENIGFSLPYCLYVDSIGTMPHARKKYSINENASYLPGGKDRISRLAIVIRAWNIFKHFSLFNCNTDVWDNSFPTIIKRASLDKNNFEFIKTLRSLVKLLNDSHARVWIAGESFYMGLPLLMKWKDTALVVTKVSETCKDVKKGDVILSVNGIPTQEYLNEKTKYISAANKSWAYLRAIAELRAGIENSSIRLLLLTKDGNKKTVNLKRNLYLNDLIEEKPPYATELKSGIFYIDLTRISDKMFYNMLDSLHYAKAIIFDLRGTTAISEHILSFFITEPVKSVKWQIPVYTKPNFKPVTYKTIQATIKARGALAGINVVFLEDERTLGYAESILSVVKNNHIGEIVGKTSAGTAGEISAFSLGSNYGFSWTTIKAVDSEGRDIYGGVAPTMTIDEVRNSDSELMKVVYELIK